MILNTINSINKFISKDQGLIFNLLDGVIRIIILVLYILVISFMKDVQVLFQYNGAEHKAVNCYEAKKPLTQASKFSTIHKRCGTSFLFIVLIVSMIIFSFITDPRW